MKDRSKLFPIVLAGVAAGCFLAFGYYSFYNRALKPAGKSYDSSRLDHQVRIEGFHFFSVQAGRRVLSLEAASFSIEKKKIGFFRFALAHTARIVDGRLAIFIEPDERRSAEKSDEKQARFPRLLSDAVLKDFPVPLGKITSLEVEPISIRIMEGDVPRTIITATSAEIRLHKKDMRFAGSVKVVSGQRTLDADEMIFDPRQGTLKTDRPYRMTNGKETTAGKHVQTDIFLQPVAPVDRQGKAS